MAVTSLDVAATRRISLGLFAATGALFVTAVNLAGAATIADKPDLAAELAKSTFWLTCSLGASLISFIWTEFAAHPDTPQSGGRHSKENYLQSAFAMLAVLGFISFARGGYLVADAVGLY